MDAMVWTLFGGLTAMALSVGGGVLLYLAHPDSSTVLLVLMIVPTLLTLAGCVAGNEIAMRRSRR